MITATVAGSHRFGTVRRRGYDPAEVDAVVERLTDALTVSEQRIARLEARLENSEVSAGAITRTLAAVEATRIEMIEEAATESEQIRQAARSEAADIAELAERLGHEVSARRDAILTEAFEEADAIVVDATLAASVETTRAAMAAESIVDDAIAEAQRARNEAEHIARTREMGAAWAVRAARNKTDRMVADAHQEAARIIRDADFEQERLTARLTELRAALRTLEAAASALAGDTLERARVIDLGAVEAAGIQIAPETITLVETPPEPIEIAGTPTVEDDDAVTDVDTYYQRRGRTLRERIEIARSMP
ncbi:MAG: DivIVA domain-containing protein [Acidimicrobiia bacterium]|nr:DivIVA domain-containing protein [Acidimicrobiia bacterium]